MRRAVRVLMVLALAATAAVFLAPDAQSADSFRVGVPTVVDPIRGAGEPDIAVDNNGNALITGPGGSGSQTSWFWHSADGGQTYPLLGPSGGHMICPASGGGDSLVVPDRATNTLYLTDQEALADIGSSVLKPDGTLQNACATAPAITADRPFESVFSAGTSAVSRADGNKPIIYLSYLCDACFGSGNTVGGLAYGWSDDGVHFHPADPGSAIDTPATNAFSEAAAINTLEWHGSMVSDPRTGWVYTAISCTSTSGCPDGATKDEVGVAIGKPHPATHPTNPGVFDTVDYQTVADLPEASSLFPVLSMDSAGTMYEMWTAGDGFASPDARPSDTSWHIFYSYSLDTPDHGHKTWSPPIRVDKDSNGSTVFGWFAAGDAGKLGFVWLQSDVREHPSKLDPNRQWRPHMAVTTNGNTANPSFQEDAVGTGPAHLGDICLEGTVGCIQNVGNRNLADFISADVDPATGALQATWANDANQLATAPTTLIPGLPLVETARQVSGPRLVGTGLVKTNLFSTASATSIADAAGDGRYPVGGTSNVAPLDLTRSGVARNGANLTVTIDVADATATATASPNALQPNVWYLTVWQFKHKLYFAKAKVDSAGNVTYTAGAPTSFDRVGLNGQTVATLVDYSGGTTVVGKRTATGFSLTVPVALVGAPGKGSLLEAVTAYTALDSGLPPEIGPGAGNVPTITDATPAYNTTLAK